MKRSLEETVRAVREEEGTVEMLRITSMATVLLSVYAVGYLLVSLLAKAPMEALRVALLLLLPLIAVSVVRRLVSAPRPFELYGIEPPKGRHAAGRSFPSRHAHAAFAIATVLFFYSPVFAALVAAVGAFGAIARVLLGLHFPRDVITGALTGTVCSALGMLIFFL